MGKSFRKIVRVYAAGEIVFAQGAEADGIYSLRKGRVSVFRKVAAPDGIREIELAQLGPGSMFGEMGVLGGARRDASVRALEAAEALIITREMFDGQMAALPPWVRNFVKILIQRLRGANDKLAAAARLLDAHGLALPENEAEAAGPAAPEAGSG